MNTTPDFLAILSGFSIDFEHLVSVEPLGKGHINDTYKVVLDRAPGRSAWVLQRVNRFVFQHPFAVTENLVRVGNYLRKNKYPLRELTVVAPRNIRDGDWMIRGHGGDCWRMLFFFDHTITFDKAETVELAYEAAKAFGTFGRYLDGIDTAKLFTTIPGFHDGMARLAYFKEVLQRALPQRLAEAGDEVAEILQNQAIFEKVGQLKLPTRAVHHDTKINNLLFDENTRKPLVVVDLDTVMPGIVLSDFGDMARTFTCPADEDEADLSKVEMRMPYYQAVKEGFLSEMGAVLTREELQSLDLAGPWLTLMQAVRFLADYLEGDPYYKTKYPTHNLVRARNQLALFRSMQRQLPQVFFG